MVIAVLAIALLGSTPIEEEKPDKASGFKACFALLGKPFILLSFIGIMGGVEEVDAKAALT